MNQLYLIARCLEHGLCGTRIVRFKIAIECVDEEYGLAAFFRPKRSLPAKCLCLKKMLLA